MNFPNRLMLRSAALACLVAAISICSAQPRTTTQLVTQPQPGVTILSSDAGTWGGASMGTSHQNNEPYWTEKTLIIPDGALAGVQQARLRVFMLVRDNSHAGGNAPNGLDEAFEVIVNGKPHLFQTSNPALPSAGPRDPLNWRWHDFIIPVAQLKPGANSFIFRKTPSRKSDDYLYIGTDNTVSAGQSRSSQNAGQSWGADLNTIGARGEYMARLLLLQSVPQSQAEWTPQQMTDPNRLIGYVEQGADAQSPALTFEIDPYRFDVSQPFKVSIDYRGTQPLLRWFDEEEQAVAVESTPAAGTLSAEIAQQSNPLARLEIVAPEGKAIDVQRVRFEYSRPVGGDVQQRIDMAPRVLPAKGKPQNREPGVLLTDNGFTLHNSTLAARFETKPSLHLVSLHNEYLQKNVLAHPEATQLFLIEINDKRYSARDWQVRGVKALSPTRVAVDLALPDPALRAKLTIGIDAQNLRFGLNITNASSQTQSWKTAFPHLGGIQLSEKSEDDYYLFPLWGGAIANANVNLKTNYGDESAWWQMVDVFSPAGGAGLMLRNVDETGLYKGIALRKGQQIVAEGGFSRDARYSYMEPDMVWRNALDAGPGISTAFEYLKYTREPGGSFSPPEAALQMHEGDWHTAMREYSDWAHRVWKWQQSPSKLRDVWNIQGAGWGQSPLYKDGAWRTDFINDKADVIELMSWWQWSKKGPWQVPMDRLEEELGESFFKAYKNYWVVNPATGQLEYPLNRGDYEYNTDWGGLPALRKYLEEMRARGVMPMFYTDPILADDNTRLGHQYGPKYGVMNPIWKASGYASEKKTPPGYVGSYGGYNMCLDNAWYQDFVVDLTARLVRDTGVDGIRFDEFGHRGYTCLNPQHEHIFAEKGHNAWMQAVTLACRRTQEAVEKLDPDFVLTAEFPGNDHLAATLEGAVNYESAQHVFRAFRPIPLNVMRFYFPEHKHYDLDTTNRAHGREWRFWNATGAAFSGAVHPPRYHRILEENSETFDSRKVMPLVPSLAQGVYVNRFEGGGKTIHLLYNARGFTVNEPVLSAPAKAGFHYFDLLSGEEIQPQNGAVSLKLRPNKVAAIAQLPRVLQVQKNAGDWQVNLARAVPNAKVALCKADGEIISEHVLTGTRVLLPASQEQTATFVKLLQGKYLVDAASFS